MDIYPPAEDSHLLEKHVRSLVYGRVLDMGTGSGIQALAALPNGNVREVIAVDINEHAIQRLQEEVQRQKLRKIKVLQSDLFAEVEGHFNFIIFNPPYLPQDKGIIDPALYGGKRGWELAARFFAHASAHLDPEGTILFLFSSLTNKQKINEIICHHLFEFKEIDAFKIAFEELYVYEVRKSPLLRELEAKGITTLAYYAKGKRSLVYQGIINLHQSIKSHLVRPQPIKVAIKVQREESTALNVIAQESLWLQKIQPLKIAPRFFFSGKDSQGREYVVVEFVDGKPLLVWIKSSEKKSIILLLQEILRACYALDQIHVNKEEMHHPFKHIIITDNQLRFIDFERCQPTSNPKNVTQFVEAMGRMQILLQSKGLNLSLTSLRTAAQTYKNNPSRQNFETIINLFS